MRNLRRRLRERGATLPFVAIVLFVLVGFTALVVDVGHLYVVKQRHVNACDAAAMAGALEYLFSPLLPEEAKAVAEAKAVQVAKLNGLPMTATGGSVPDPEGEEAAATRADTITAKVTLAGTMVDGEPANYSYIDVTSRQENTPLFFARIFGREWATVGARSRWIWGAPNVLSEGTVEKLGGLRPWGIQDAAYATGDRVMLKLGDMKSDLPSGNTLPVRLEGNGVSEYRRLILNGSVRKYAVGDPIDSEPGNMGQNTGSTVYELLLRDRFNEGCADFDTVSEMDEPWNCARVVLVPMVDWTWEGVKNGMTELPIRGFALFWIEGTNYMPNNSPISYYTGEEPLNNKGDGDEVYGRFLTTNIPSEGTQINPETPPPDFGLVVVRPVYLPE